MIVGEATVTVTASPTDVIDFVLDLNRYRQADRKIGRIGPMHRSGNHGTVQFSGRVRGLPAPTGTYPFTVTTSGLHSDHPSLVPPAGSGSSKGPSSAIRRQTARS